MSNRREIIEAALFLPLMALIAAVIFGGMYAIIVFGGTALRGFYGLLHITLHLPHPVALALAVILAALTVYTVVPRLLGALGDLLNRPRA